MRPELSRLPALGLQATPVLRSTIGRACPLFVCLECALRRASLAQSGPLRLPGTGAAPLLKGRCNKRSCSRARACAQSRLGEVQLAHSTAHGGLRTHLGHHEGLSAVQHLQSSPASKHSSDGGDVSGRTVCLHSNQLLSSPVHFYDRGEARRKQACHTANAGGPARQ